MSSANSSQEESPNDKKSKTKTEKGEDKKKKQKKTKSKKNNSNSENEKEENKKEKEEKKNQMIMKDLIAENFVMLKLIGKGAFGQIYLSFDMRDNVEVSIKKEIKKFQKHPQLRTEAKIYQTLLNISSTDLTGTKALSQDEIQGVPHFYGMGELFDSFYLIIEFLGPNLMELFNFCGCHKFTISTVSLIALQMLNRIEYLHKHHYIHRDIKPENFLIGTKEKSNIIFLIDFGLSKRYKNPKNHQHIPYREGRSLIGTARYVSINTHLGIEQSRRDDLESIGYVLIFFLKGILPWQGMKAGGDKYQRIMEKKLQIPTEILCYGLPDELVYYLNYSKSLRFEDRPDYDYLRGLFIRLLGTCNNVYGLSNDMLKFDWCFDDPATSIWQVFNKKGKGININSTNQESNKDVGGNNNIKKINEIIEQQNKGKLENIYEVKETFAKTNENNSQVNLDEDEEDSSSDSENNKNKKDDNDNNKKENENNDNKNYENNDNIGNENKDNRNNENKKNEDNDEESDETIKEEFNAQKLNLDNNNEEGITQQLKNILNKEEDIDIYINKLLQKKGININNNNNSKNNNINNNNNNSNNNINVAVKKGLRKSILKHAVPDVTPVIYNDNKNSNSNSNSNSKSKSSSSSDSESEKKDEVPPTLGTGKINLKDSLDIPNPDGKDRRKSVLRQSPENIKKKLEDMNKLFNNDKVVAKNTYRNSKMISLADLNKIHALNGIDGNDKGKKEKKVEVKEENKEEKKEEKKVNKKKRASVSFNLGIDIKNEDDSKNKPSFENQVINNNKDNKDDEEKKEELKGDISKRTNHSHNTAKSQKLKISNNSKQQNTQLRKVNTKVSELDLLDNPDINVSKENLIKISREPISKNYIIICDLGQGSYGQVKKVLHKQLNEVRAMKMTSKKTTTSKIEINILRKISHPNIANIYEIYEDSRKYYIMMEFLEGGELFEAITSAGSFNELSAMKVMKQLLDAIYYCHTERIVHRDLKPENIMLTNQPKDDNYQIKLIDFGAATNFIPGKKINKFIGTAYYIAPEVLKENYDEKCDIWSCGVIMYILLCGYPPFNGNTNLDIYHNIRTRNPTFTGSEWEPISKEAVDLIKNMLNKNPVKRFSAQKCLNHQWFKLLEDAEKNKFKNFHNIQKNAITQMAQFVQENRFKKAVLQFISSQFDIQKEENDLKEIFKSLDTTGKGQLTRAVFTEKLIELYGENDGKYYADKIFSNLDLDGSGQISYDEFLSSMISSKKIVTDERLEKAFKMFDKDNSGKLSVHEIISVFGGDEDSWKKVIEQIDLNEDGEVDFNEFKLMMLNVDKNVGIKKNIKSKRTITKPENID